MNEPRQDFELLRDFVRRGNQPAFAAIVRRHADLVYATALRKVEDQNAAEEVAQDVFNTLARKAWQFGPGDSVPAWLYRTTLLKAKACLRGEIRRRRREQIAAELGTTMRTPDEPPGLRTPLPLLDEALLSLRDKERAALLLRFYEKQSLRDVGAALGVSEDAAQKRVAGALQRLTQFFQRRGFTTVTVAAATAALYHTATPAPATVASALARSAMQTGPPTLGGLAVFLSSVAALTRLQQAIVCIALLAAPAVWHWHQTSGTANEDGRRGTELAAAPAQQQSVAVVPQNSPRRQAPSPQTQRFVTPAFSIPPDEKEYTTHLKGVAALSDFKAPLLHIHHHSLDAPSAPPFGVRRLLREGEAFDDLAVKGAYVRFEISEINSNNPSVKARENGEERLYELEDPSGIKLRTGEPSSVLWFPNPDFNDFLDLYAALVARTVLCHPLVKGPSLPVAASPKNKAEAAAALERMLREKGMRTIPDGDRFILVVPSGLADSIRARASETRPTPASANADLPAGSIDFQGTDLSQVLMIYGELISRARVENQRALRASFFFRNQTPLSKAEAILAFERLFAGPGLKVECAGDKLFKVVPIPSKP